MRSDGRYNLLAWMKTHHNRVLEKGPQEGGSDERNSAMTKISADETAIRSLAGRKILAAFFGLGAIASLSMVTFQAAHAEYSFDANRSTVTGNASG